MKILTAGKYYGAKKSEIRLGGIILSEYDYLAPGTEWHYHENPYFMYVLQGNLYDINKKNKKQCDSGSLIFHNWQEVHRNTKESKRARGFHLELTRNWFEQRKLDVDLWEGSKLLEHPKLHSLLGEIYFEFKCWDSFSTVSIELLMLQLLENIQSLEFSSQKEPAWVDQLRQILQEDSEDLNLTSLSQKLGIHPVHISRAVPKYLASSLGDYIRQQKIKQSLSFILNQQYSLTEIANLCGFSDQSHFTRTFKFYVNKTPSEFRKQVL